MRSHHYGDIANWIKEVIESCKTNPQLKTAKKLGVNFDKRLSSEYQKSHKYYDLYFGLIIPLNSLIENKWKI